MYSAFWGIKVARLKTIKTHRVPVPSLSEEALRPPIQSLLATALCPIVAALFWLSSSSSSLVYHYEFCHRQQRNLQLERPLVTWRLLRPAVPGGNCIRIGLPGKLILSKRTEPEQDRFMEL